MRGMKAKTIRKVLRAKLDALLETLVGTPLHDMVADDAIVTGGSIASMLLGEDVNDFDIYFRRQETAIAVAEHYVKQYLCDNEFVEMSVLVDGDRVAIRIPSEGMVGGERLDSADGECVADDAGGEFVPVFISQHAITLSGQVQLIVRFTGEADDIHKNYDFVHCTNHWSAKTDELVLHPKALESLLSKELSYQGSLYPVCSVIRLRKFIARGWVINAGQILKMMLQVSELDLTDIEVLEDQLTGVDTAYFFSLLQQLKEGSPEKINAAYVSEIIERVFG